MPWGEGVDAPRYGDGVDDMALRSLIYRHIVDTGNAPSRQFMLDVVGPGADT